MIPRKSYTVQYKLRVIEYSEQYSAKVASKIFNIHLSMIGRWKKKLMQMKESKPTLRRVGAPGRMVSYPVLECELNEWIVNQRRQALPVSYTDVKEKMLTLAPSSFKASNSWLSGFLSRFNLSLRTITKQVRNATVRSENEIQEKVELFRNFIRNMKETRIFDRIINVDQTPVWFSIGSTGKTVDAKGSKAVACKCHSNSRDRVTVILACGEDGFKLPPAIIVKSNRRELRVTLVDGVLVFENPKTAMANSEIMAKWVDLVVPTNTLLILDSFKGHLTDQIKDTCDSLGITRAVIPGGFTGILQPLDLTVNKSFKAKLKRFYCREGLREVKSKEESRLQAKLTKLRLCGLKRSILPGFWADLFSGYPDSNLIVQDGEADVTIASLIKGHPSKFVIFSKDSDLVGAYGTDTVFRAVKGNQGSNSR